MTEIGALVFSRAKRDRSALVYSCRRAASGSIRDARLAGA